MPLNRKLMLIPLLLLAACDSNDPHDICEAALQGALVSDNRSIHNHCVTDVWLAQHKAGYDAARKYRELPR